AGVATVIFTSGAVKPFIASQTVCACAAPEAAIVIPAASAAAQTVPLSMSSSRGFFCAEPATHGGGPQRHRHANRAHERCDAASRRDSATRSRPLVPGLHDVLQAGGGLRTGEAGTE